MYNDPPSHSTDPPMKASSSEPRKQHTRISSRKPHQYTHVKFSASPIDSSKKPATRAAFSSIINGEARVAVKFVGLVVTANAIFSMINYGINLYHMKSPGFRLDNVTGGHQPHFNVIQRSIEVLDVISPDKKTSNVPWNGIENAEWCQAPVEDPLPYENCRWDSFVFQFGVHGGLTNALHFILKGAIWAFEEDVCFFVDEELGTMLATRGPPEQTILPFLNRYFEHIGLPKDSPKVKLAKNNQLFVRPKYHQIQYHTYGKHTGGLDDPNYPKRFEKRTIESLNYYDIEKIHLKKIMMRRLFRILPDKRNVACSRLVAKGLGEEYIAMSVRRGDKALEYKLESSMQPYIDKAEQAIQSHFGGKVPTIFVASDDCTVMEELRAYRPQWKFVGECDNATEDNGFVLAHMMTWSLEQTDNHYQKFITEMIAMASAKYWIGVSTTNVSFWMYFMRHYKAHDDTFVFVDTDKIIH